MADVNRGNRPLSPHIQVYRFPLNGILSITHRATGVAMAAAGVLIVWYFLALAIGPDAFATADAVLTSWFGDIVFFLSVCALWFHFANGVRHLVWDTGSHFGQKSVNRSALIGLVFAAVMVAVTVIVG